MEDNNPIDDDDDIIDLTSIDDGIIDLTLIVTQAEIAASPEPAALTISLADDDGLIELTDVIDADVADMDEEPIELTELADIEPAPYEAAAMRLTDADGPIELIDIVAGESDDEMIIDLTDMVASTAGSGGKEEIIDLSDIVSTEPVVDDVLPAQAADGRGDDDEIGLAPGADAADDELDWVDISDIDLPDELPDNDLPAFLKNRRAQVEESLELSDLESIDPLFDGGVDDDRPQSTAASIAPDESLSAEEDMEQTLAKLEQLMQDTFVEENPAAGSAGPAAGRRSEAGADDGAQRPQPVSGKNYGDFPIGIAIADVSADAAQWPDERIEAVLEQLIRTRYGRTIEQLIADTVERLVTREIESVRRSLLEDDDPID